MLAEIDDPNEGFFAQKKAVARPICDIEGEGTVRLPTGLEAFDRVLGGGFTSDAVILLGGDPGAGKSTGVLQVAELLARRGLPVLYATGEESAEQVADRGRRLGARSRNLLVLASQDVEEILALCKKTRPALLVVDSLQSMRSAETTGAVGGVAAQKKITNLFASAAKELSLPVLMICHIIKSGALSGPKALEHIVDAVLSLSVDGQRRLLAASKNRFGSTSEIGVFAMTGAGLVEAGEEK
jgi:DNA repair protein RadA/Sms